MATYGRYEVIAYASGYKVTDMNTHEAVFQTASRSAAHTKAQRLHKLDREAQFNAPLGVILPNGNAAEFPKLDAELAKRGVEYKVYPLPGGARVYRIRRDHIGKLPHDERGHYLGDDESGHSIYPITDEMIVGLLGAHHEAGSNSDGGAGEARARESEADAIAGSESDLRASRNVERIRGWPYRNVTGRVGVVADQGQNRQPRSGGGLTRELRLLLEKYEHEERGSGFDPHDVLRFFDWIDALDEKHRTVLHYTCKQCGQRITDGKPCGCGART